MTFSPTGTQLKIPQRENLPPALGGSIRPQQIDFLRNANGQDSRSCRQGLRRCAATFLTLSVSLWLGACADSPYDGNSRFAARALDSRNSQPGRSADFASYWNGDDSTGPARIEIRLAEQKAYFFRRDQVVGVSALSTGREGYDTPTGQFKIIQKDEGHRSSIYGEFVDKRSGEVINPDADTTRDKAPPGAKFVGAPMPNFMRIVDGVGLHAGYLPGTPASHGCIRMPAEMSASFFRNVKVGTPVAVLP